MVSLPIRWVRKLGLSKGNELDIEERGATLIISTDKKAEPKRIDVTIDNPRELYVWRRLQPCYILGYDEVKVHVESAQTLAMIQKLAANLIGFEVVEQGRDHCVIKAVSTELDEQFGVLFYRILTNILEMSDIIERRLESKEDVTGILNLEIINNRHTMFLKRILAKSGYEKQELTPAYYALVVLLERMANEYKFFAKDLMGRQVHPAKEIIKTQKRVHQLLEDVITLYKNRTDTKDVFAKGIHTEEHEKLLALDPIIIARYMRITDAMWAAIQQIMIIRQFEDQVKK